jgi:hypothetical protein
VLEIKKTATGYDSTPITLASFNGDNAEPRGSLIADAAGDLFGTTSCWSSSEKREMSHRAPLPGDEVFGATNPSFINCRSEPLR